MFVRLKGSDGNYTEINLDNVIRIRPESATTTRIFTIGDWFIVEGSMDEVCEKISNRTTAMSGAPYRSPNVESGF
jgi:uncharacterized protein YlzI (FlbEa/FlbD family)